MNQQEAITEACRTRALVYQSIDDYSHPCDCFCGAGITCGKSSFRSTMDVENYIRKAVLAQLKADGYKIADGFDQETGASET